MFQKSQQTAVKVVMMTTLWICASSLWTLRYLPVLAGHQAAHSEPTLRLDAPFKKIIYGLSSFSYDHCACFNTQDGKCEPFLFTAIYHLSENCLYSASPLCSLAFEFFHRVSFWFLKNGAKLRRQRHQVLMSCCCCCCCCFRAHRCFAYPPETAAR